MKNFRDKFRHQASQRGFSLMEVLIGIAIFAIGMLALASLQGALTRSTAEAKVRTAAVNIAEQIIEGQRGFSLVSGTGFTYESIASITTPIVFDSTMTRDPDTVEGVSYEVTQDVTDYYYDLATDAFTTDETGAVTSDYKTVLVTVRWDDNRNFVIDEGRQTTDNLGGGVVEVAATISSLPIVTAIKVSEQDDTDIIAPPVSYTPGQNPDVIPLRVGDFKFKESTKPVPKVIRVDELVETTFDVITYSTNGGTLFLRREEFSAVSCECELKAAPGNAVGYRPTLWAGDEYTDAELVDKAYGVSANNIQSPRCETCCRDHHDGGTGGDDPDNKTDPFRASTDYWGEGDTFGGDHKHYKKDRFGNLSEAVNVDDVYVEACRMVRKDGFMRVGQNFRREGLNVFPYDFLDDTADVLSYSNYTTGAVETYFDSTADGYESSPPTLTLPSRPDLVIRSTRIPI